mgnify:FL=1
MKIGALVLAAGFSKRFGTDKRTESVQGDEPMLLLTIKNLARHFEEIVVVLRDNDQIIADLVLNRFQTSRIIIHHAKNSIEGIGTSLGSTIAIVTERKWESAFVFLGDMPYIKQETISKLKTEALTNPFNIIVPKFGTKTGHPVCFPNLFYKEIESLSGDVGAKKIIDSNLERVVFVKTTDRGVNLDVDTPIDIFDN